MAKKGLATTTASGHEVQGREFAEDRHVEVQSTPSGRESSAIQALRR
jgi:hypothetical protein